MIRVGKKKKKKPLDRVPTEPRPDLTGDESQTEELKFRFDRECVMVRYSCHVCHHCRLRHFGEKKRKEQKKKKKKR